MLLLWYSTLQLHYTIILHLSWPCMRVHIMYLVHYKICTVQISIITHMLYYSCMSYILGGVHVHKQVLVTPYVIMSLRGGGGYPRDANG